jgi:hypothetical protein
MAETFVVRHREMTICSVRMGGDLPALEGTSEGHEKTITVGRRNILGGN